MLSISSILDMLVSLKINSTIELFSLYCVTVSLLLEVTKRVYFIGNERMLIAHDSNRLRFS